MSVSVSGAPPQLTTERLEALVAAAEAKAGVVLEKVSLTFIDPDEMRVLNRQHRGKDRPTDVLSFPFDDSFPHGSGGEVLICPEVAKETKITGGSHVDELEWLVVHGALHLAGMEDETDAGTAEMDRLTAGIISSMEQSDG